MYSGIIITNRKKNEKNKLLRKVAFFENGNKCRIKDLKQERAQQN